MTKLYIAHISNPETPLATYSNVRVVPVVGDVLDLPGNVQVKVVARGLCYDPCGQPPETDCRVGVLVENL